MTKAVLEVETDSVFFGRTRKDAPIIGQRRRRFSSAENGGYIEIAVTIEGLDPRGEGFIVKGVSVVELNLWNLVLVPRDVLDEVGD